MVIMSAATGQEASLESGEWRHGDFEGHGAFTKALLEGLEGAMLPDAPSRGGRIGIEELDLYVTNRVKELTEGRQHPMTSIPKMTSNFPVAVVD